MSGLARHADEGDVWDSIWVYDHFHTVPEPTDQATHEAWSLMAAFAASTRRIRLGQMCSCMSYRNPAYLAKVATTVDVISGGRLNMGHRRRLVRARVARLRLRVPLGRRTSGCWTRACRSCASSGPRASRRSRASTTRRPAHQPAAARPGRGIPLWIAGGGERKTLKTAAKYATHTNFDGSLETFTHKSEVLRGHCEDVGRDFSSITRTADYNVAIGRDEKEVAERIAARKASLERYVSAEAAEREVGGSRPRRRVGVGRRSRSSRSCVPPGRRPGARELSTSPSSRPTPPAGAVRAGGRARAPRGLTGVPRADDRQRGETACAAPTPRTTPANATAAPARRNADTSSSPATVADDASPRAWRRRSRPPRPTATTPTTSAGAGRGRSGRGRGTPPRRRARAGTGRTAGPRDDPAEPRPAPGAAQPGATTIQLASSRPAVATRTQTADDGRGEAAVGRDGDQPREQRRPGHHGGQHDGGRPQSCDGFQRAPRWCGPAASRRVVVPTRRAAAHRTWARGAQDAGGELPRGWREERDLGRPSVRACPELPVVHHGTPLVGPVPVVPLRGGVTDRSVVDVRTAPVRPSASPARDGSRQTGPVWWSGRVRLLRSRRRGGAGRRQRTPRRRGRRLRGLPGEVRPARRRPSRDPSPSRAGTCPRRWASRRRPSWSTCGACSGAPSSGRTPRRTAGTAATSCTATPAPTAPPCGWPRNPCWPRACPPPTAGRCATGRAVPADDAPDEDALGARRAARRGVPRPPRAGQPAARAALARPRAPAPAVDL